MPSFKITKKQKVSVVHRKIDLTSDSDEDPVVSSRGSPTVAVCGDKQVDIGDRQVGFGGNQPASHNSIAISIVKYPALEKAVDVCKKAQDFFKLKNTGLTTQLPNIPSSKPIPQTPVYTCMKYSKPSVMPVHPQRSSTSSKPPLFRNSMESSLPALTHRNKRSTKTINPNGTQLHSTNHRPSSGNHCFQVTDMQSPKTIDSKAVTSNEHLEQSQGCWNDECLGLESANVSFVKQSDITDEPSTPSSPSAVCTDSSESSPIHDFINKREEELNESIDHQEKQVKVRSRNNSGAISIDSQSPAGSPTNKLVLDEYEDVESESGDEGVVKKQQEVAGGHSREDPWTSKFFLPPTTSIGSMAHTNVQSHSPVLSRSITNPGMNKGGVRSQSPDSIFGSPLLHKEQLRAQTASQNKKSRSVTNPGTSEGGVPSQSPSTNRTILDCIDEPSGCLSPEQSFTSVTTPERITVPSRNFLPRESKNETVSSTILSPLSHSNPFSKHKGTSNLHDSILGSPLLHKEQLNTPTEAPNKKLSLKRYRQAASVQSGSPSLSTEEFTIELPTRSERVSSGDEVRVHVMSHVCIICLIYLLLTVTPVFLIWGVQA